MSEPNTSAPTPTAVAPLRLPPAIARPLAQVRGILVGLSKPARVMLGTLLVLGIAVGGFFTYRAANVPYSALYSQLEREDAAALVNKLRELHVPYRLEADGTAISVPEAQVHEVRLQLATAGLPRGGGVGFESFDNLRLGATEFEQRVLYRRALEGELSRSISTLASVQSARVHLVLPERSVFVSRAEPASGSIIIHMRPGHTLGAAEVNGIVHMTAASVPGLTPERIALVTTDGIMLHRPRPAGDDANAMAGGDDERATALRAQETSLEDRARSLLERAVGPGHADVRATVEMDLARVEHTEDRFDPAHTLLRSESESVEHAAGSVGTPGAIPVAGVPGAESNLPTGSAPGAPPARPAATAAATAAGIVRESHTRNFEFDHVQERRTMLAPTVHRITVAVVVDGVPHDDHGHITIVPRDRAELDRYAGLVRSAVGASEARGDIVTVESVPFIDPTLAFADPSDRPGNARPALHAPTAPGRANLPAGIGAAVLLVLVLGASVVARRRRATNELALANDVALADGGARHDAVVEQVDNLANLRVEAHGRAASDPATAAMVLRFWLGTSSEPAPVAVPGTTTVVNRRA